MNSLPRYKPVDEEEATMIVAQLADLSRLYHGRDWTDLYHLADSLLKASDNGLPLRY